MLILDCLLDQRRARQPAKVFDEWRSEYLIKIDIDGVLQSVSDRVVSQLLAGPNKNRLPHAIQIYARTSLEDYECGDSAGINIAQHGCAGNRCSDGPHLDFCAAGFHIRRE